MNAQVLEWNDLRFVLAVCRQGTLSGAARELGVNHSTVFRRIGAIEEKVAMRLFERLPTGYVMTEASEAMLKSAEIIEAEMFNLSRKLVGGDTRLSGALHVTAPDALAIEILLPHIVSFCRTYPGIELNLSVENSFLDLSLREADVAIRSTTTPPETAVGRRLCNLGATIYGASQYLDDHSGATLEEYAWLMPQKNQGWFSANQWLAQHHPEASVVFRSNTLLALFEAVKQGLGVAPLPFFLADPEVGLKRVLAPPKEFTSELWLLTHPDLRRTARVRAFVEFLREAIGHVQNRIEG
ncbi:LysR family transcriptional regulator [Sulfuriflexus mobilis]|uniref:LysR family transcriptional regulator n=1 Tax=Sulfuriflexus mobilis TaxID=1811807 RepID=UPI000F832797|nr:LysR family transcriptional regulator [Sulfuriflexus mobilis]